MSNTQERMAIRTSSKPLTTEYDIMFDRDIDHANEWHEELYTMRQAGEGDLVNLHINTCGGAVSTISAFQNIKKNSSAHFHGILEGIGYSAGSAFFLMCDTQEVADFAEMMIHTSQSSGFYSHSQGREENGKQTARTARILVEAVYKDFLTDIEIEELLIGKEFWLDAKEIRTRLEKRDEIRNQRNIEEVKKTYTPEFYAEQISLDLLEDCEGFGYDPKDIIQKVMEILSEKSDGGLLDQMAEVIEEGVNRNQGYTEQIKAHHLDCALNHKYSDEYHSVFELLKTVAVANNISFAHNISIQKLYERVKDFVEIV